MPSLLKSRGGVGVDQDESTARARRRRDRSRALHPAGRRTPSRRRPPLGTPHQQHRPNQRRHRRLSGSGPPPSTPSASISYSPPIPPTPGSSGTPTIIGRRRRGRIPLYPGISRYIPAYLGSFFLFAGTKALGVGTTTPTSRLGRRNGIFPATRQGARGPMASWSRTATSTGRPRTTTTSAR